MSVHAKSVLADLLEALVGVERCDRLFRILVVPESLCVPGEEVSRAVLAQALNMLLFEDLVQRVPAAQTYVERSVTRGEKIFHDHGAVRTVDRDGMGGLPRGQAAITRLLAPLGYELRGTYPLERLRMTGRSYAQADLPEAIAQFFISELHVDRFPAAFAEAVDHVTSNSNDPLTTDGAALLDELQSKGSLSLARAARLLPVLVACFDRQHEEATVADYEALLAHSAEMAWIATEGNAFNHATDRVADVEKLTREQKALGQPMKDKVEVSGTGRVRQTAFLAAKVQRKFRAADGTQVEREVTGSFLEFIARDYIPSEELRTAIPGEETRPALDLSFDPSNAQAIFKMTATGQA